MNKTVQLWLCESYCVHSKCVIFLNIYKCYIKCCLGLKPTRNIITMHFSPRQLEKAHKQSSKLKSCRKYTGWKMGNKQGELRGSPEPGCLVPRVSLKRPLAGGEQSRSGGRVPGRGAGSSGNRGHGRGARKAKPTPVSPERF